MSEIVINFELWGIIVTVIGAILTITKIYQKWSMKMAEHKRDIAVMLGKISERTDKNEGDIVEVKEGQKDLKTDIYREISEMKKSRERDFKTLTDMEEKHHSEVIGRIMEMQKKVSEICGSFNEFRREKSK